MNSKTYVMLVGAALATVVIGFLIWTTVQPSPFRGPRHPATPTPEERRVEAAVAVLERLCLVNLSSEAKDQVSVGLKTRLTNAQAAATANQGDAIARGAAQDLPPDVRRAEGDQIRTCITTHFPMVVAALTPSAPSLAKPDTDVPAPDQPVAPPEPVVVAEADALKQTPADQPAPVKVCARVKNLAEMNFRGGHKTDFCRSNGFDGVTNFPGKDYWRNGGGYCFVGDADACLAEARSR